MRKRACVLLVGLLAFPSPRSIAADRPTPESIRKAIELHRNSIDRFLVECDEFVPDKNGERRPGSGLMRYEYVSGKGGQKRMRITNILPDGTERLLEDVREDGRHIYRVRISRAGQIERVESRPQQSQGHAWDGTKFAALWLVLPAGRTLTQHLEAGAKLDVMPDGETATIAFKHRGMAGVCELSGRHDWLARSVTLNGGTSRWVVDSFGRADGRWYPASGYCIRMGSRNARATSRRFDVTRFRYRVRPDPHLFDFQDKAKATTE